MKLSAKLSLAAAAALTLLAGAAQAESQYGYASTGTGTVTAQARVTREDGTAYGPLMAAATLVIAPLVVAFLVAQRRFVEGITFTGLKG